MKVIELNEGKKIAYEVSGNTICFEDDLSINLEKRERDNKVTIDVCYNEDGQLVIGEQSGKYYAATIEIPERKYVEEIDEEATSEDGEASKTKLVPIPFDIDNCTLYLYAI